MPRFPKHTHLLPLTTSPSQYIKYLSSLPNRDKERQVIYGDSRDVVFFTYRLMTGEKHELLRNTEGIIKEVVNQYQGDGAKDQVKCREEIFKILHIDKWETSEKENWGVSPGFVLYCRASTYRFMKGYQRELRDAKKGEGLLDVDSTGSGKEAVTAEQLVKSLCDTDGEPMDQVKFCAMWESYLMAQGVSLDLRRCNDLGVWAAQRKKLDDDESDPTLEPHDFKI